MVFAVFLVVCVAVFWSTMRALWHAALDLDFCSQILAAPVISMGLLYWRRKEIFRDLEIRPQVGASIFIAGWLVYELARHSTKILSSYDALSAATCGIILVWVSGFSAIYGMKALRAAVFPLGFLLSMVPIPSYVLHRTVWYLQSGSTVIAQWLFELFRVPVMRSGFVLSLPGLTIEVAKECSSIRSSIALVITCLLAGYLFLRSPWKRTVLVLLAIPLSVFKNGVRIVTLSLLSIYVNPAFMSSDLHRDGGFLFYLLALAMLFPLMLWFERQDRRPRPRAPAD